MSSGFNTDVRVGDRVFHVQTEDRGPAHPVIDTVVYQNGRVLHRRSSNYSEFAASAQFDAEELGNRVREQHKSVIDALRAGSLDRELAAAAQQAAEAQDQAQAGAPETVAASLADVAADLAVESSPGPKDSTAIQVQLLNSGSWLTAGKVLLELAISRRADSAPAAGAEVEATIEGSLKDTLERATTDAEGRARIQFPLPPLGKGDLALIVRARSGGAHDEIRFAMRTRAKNPPAGVPQ